MSNAENLKDTIELRDVTTMERKPCCGKPDGFVLLYKRLDNGRYQWPRNSQKVKALSWEQFTWLMQGLNIEQPKALRPGRAKDLA